MLESSLHVDELDDPVHAAITKATRGFDPDEALVTPTRAPLVLDVKVGDFDFCHHISG